MWRIVLLLFMVGVSVANAQTVRAALSVEGMRAPARVDIPSTDSNEPSYQGKPLSYWLKSLQNRDDQMKWSFEAIRKLGPAAAAAVPELTRFISEPFRPIEVWYRRFGRSRRKIASDRASLLCRGLPSCHRQAGRVFREGAAAMGTNRKSDHWGST